MILLRIIVSVVVLFLFSCNDNIFNNRKVWSNYMKIGRNLNKNDIYHPPDLDDVDIEWE